MKIIFYEIQEEDKKSIESLIASTKELQQCEIVYSPERLTSLSLPLAHDADIVGVFVNSPITQEHMDAMPNLKLIVTMSTGFDHIDTAYAKTKNIAVCNVPGYGSRTVAEFTFALILGLSRKLCAAYRQVKDQQNFSISPFEGFNLQGKTLGIIGTGRIGQNVAKIAKGFEMNIICYDAFENKEAAKEIGFTYMPLIELLSSSDIITIHVPYNKDTHHLIHKQNITSVKQGACIINTARGEVIETEALIEGLHAQRLSGVGIDVLEGEKNLTDEWHLIASEHETETQLKMLALDHALIKHPRVIYTPHIAFFTKEAKKEIVTTTIENISSFLNNIEKNRVH